MGGIMYLYLQIDALSNVLVFCLIFCGEVVLLSLTAFLEI